jgi:outer membrane protein assembly factor BamB
LVVLLLAILLIPSRTVAGDPSLDSRGHGDGVHEVNVLPLAVRWSVDLGGPPVARAIPVVDDERVFVALRSGQIVARSLVDGAEKWRKDLPTEQPIAVDGGVVFVLSRDTIHALRASDGAALWEAPVAKVTAPLVARAGWLIVLAERRAIAFRANDGVSIWQRDVGGSMEPPAVNGDRVYLSLDDGRIVSLDITTGRSIWETRVGAVAGELAAAGDRVYGGASDRLFYCLKAQTGEVDWAKRIGAAIVGAAVVDSARVYFLALDNVVRALDRSNGNQRWQHSYPKRASTGPAIGGNYAFVASSSSPDIWMWTGEGQRAGSLTLPAAPVVPPAIVERGPTTLDVLTITGNLAGQWQLTLLTSAGEPPLVPFTVPGGALKPEERYVPAEPPLVPLAILPGTTLEPEAPVIQERDVPAALGRIDASSSARNTNASRETPASIRSGVGAENDSRMVLAAR